MKKNFIGIFTFCLFISVTNSFSQGLDSFYQEAWIPRTYVEPEVQYPRSLNDGAADAVVSIYASDTVSKVLPIHFGVNTPFRNGDGMLTDSIRFPMYKHARLGTYRFPAGSGSNIYFWDGNPPAEFRIPINPIDGTQSSALKPENFVRFIDSLGSQATVVVNYFYARYGKTAEGTRESRVMQAAKYAAGFVHKMNVELEAGIKYWEIGNECYGAWEEGYDVNGSIVTGTEYGEDFRVFAEEMKKVDSTIKIGAVLYTKDTDWNPGVIREVQDDADFFIIHDYFTPEKDATIENILGSVGKINENMNLLATTVEQETDKTLDDFPVALTEFNCRGPHTTTMTDGMFITQILGEVIKNKLGMSAMWVSEWKWKADREPKSFLAVEDPTQNDYTARPSYMPYHFYGKCFGDHMVNSSVSGDGINAYASKFSSGEIGIVVVNTNGYGRNVKLNFTGFIPSELQWYEIYSNTIEPGDKKFYINGETGLTAGGGPDDFYDVPPYRSDYADNLSLYLPAFSINFIVAKGMPNSIHAANPKDLIRIFPNPVQNKLFVDTEKKVEQYSIFNSAGSLVSSGSVLNNCIETADLERGYHLLQLIHENDIVNVSFIKL